MNLFERIHDAIKQRLGQHADENTPVDTEALANEVIEAHAEHVAENTIPTTPDDVVPEKTEPVVEQKSEEKAAES